MENDVTIIKSPLIMGGIIESRIGGRKENQDSYGYAETKVGLLIVVCDGMGGANGGRTASNLAVNTILDEVSNTELPTAEEILIQAISKANSVVYTKSIEHTDLRGMGTTVVAILIDDEKVTAAHVGDSRIYQIRGKKKVFRTFDHSMVFELVRRGTITEEQARLSAESNVILRALGTKKDIDVEIDNNIPYLKGDRFLLCSDGICGAVSEPELLAMIVANKSPKTTVEMMTEKVDNIGIGSGGHHDNLTAALIEMNTNSKMKVKMNRTSKIIIGVLGLLLIASLIVNYLQYTGNTKTIKTPATVATEAPAVGKENETATKNEAAVGKEAETIISEKEDSTKTD